MLYKNRRINLKQECVLFTGKMEKLTRSEAQQAVITLGGNVADYCSQNVTVLVAGVIDKGMFENLTTIKLMWAEKHGIRVMGEAEFEELLMSGS